MSDKLDLIRELIEMTDGSEVNSANEMDVRKILSVPLGTVIYPRLSIAQAKTFVEKCMRAGAIEYINAEQTQHQEEDKAAWPNPNKPHRDYGEQ